MTLVKALLAAVGVIAAIGATSLMAAAETAVRLVPRGRARRLVDTGAKGAAAFERLLEPEGRTPASHSLVSAVSFALVAVVVGWAFGRAVPGFAPWIGGSVGVVFSAVFVFAIAEALPRALALANPESVGLGVAPMAARLVAVAYPVARALSSVWMWAVGVISKEAAPADPWGEAEDAAAGDAGTEGETDADEELIEAVEDFTEKVVREVMVPRTDMVCLSRDASVDDAIKVIREAGFSRIPLFREDLDDIVGVVYAKDLLACLGEGQCPRDLTSMAREPLFVPETKPADELLREMRTLPHIAIVADEYGGTAGLVTIEDLLEELVGEIYDEYDPQTALVADLGGGRYRVDGSLPIGDVNDRFGTALEAEADTVGGLFTELAGHIPDVGESTEVEGLRLTVEALEGRRIRQLVIEELPAPDEEEE